MEEVVSVHLSLTVIFSILNTAGIAFAVACLIFNFMFRNRKYVVVTDPSIRQPKWEEAKYGYLVSLVC